MCVRERDRDREREGGRDASTSFFHERSILSDKTGGCSKPVMLYDIMPFILFIYSNENRVLTLWTCFCIDTHGETEVLGDGSLDGV